jgi:hypothetical protein
MFILFIDERHFKMIYHWQIEKNVKWKKEKDDKWFYDVNQRFLLIVIISDWEWSFSLKKKMFLIDRDYSRFEMIIIKRKKSVLCLSRSFLIRNWCFKKFFVDRDYS